MTISDASRPSDGQEIAVAGPAVDALSITFPEGQTACIVKSPPWGDAAAVVAALGCAKGRPVILLLGGDATFDSAVPQDSELRHRLLQLFGRGLLRAADAANAAVIDGGTKTGVTDILGAAARNQPRPLDLVGVAPAGKVFMPNDSSADVSGRAALEPNHTHFVLVDSATWGGETSLLFDIAEAIADTHPVVVVVVYGGAITKDELVRSVRRHWPIVVISGLGGLADEIAAKHEKPADFVSDSQLAEVLADGRLMPFPATEPPPALSRLIGRQLGGGDTLCRATELRTRYAATSYVQRGHFYKLQQGILAFGVIGTGLALILSALQDEKTKSNLDEIIPGSAATLDAWWSVISGGHPIDLSGDPPLLGILHFLIVLVPLIVSVLLSASVRFNSGAAWIALRSSVEAIKAETYRYRARAGAYSDRETIETSRDIKLANKLETINRQLAQTQVNLTSLLDAPPDKGANDDLGLLTPAGYVRERLEGQLTYYRKKTKELDRQLFRSQLAIWIAGIVGSLLAAAGFELWIALTSALAAGFGAYLQYQNVERALTSYNQAAAELDNIILWWSAFSAEERADQANIDLLVDSTENVLAAENAAWLHQMHSVLQGLKEKQAKEITPTPGDQTTDDTGTASASQKRATGTAEDVTPNRKDSGEPSTNETSTAGSGSVTGQSAGAPAPAASSG